MAAVKETVVNRAVEHAVRAGKVPRKSYVHYFIETDGLHSRVHLQNFYSTFWPDVAEDAIARIRAWDDRGQLLGSEERAIPRFGSMFLEVGDLLSRLGATATEGIVAVDLEPPPAVRGRFADLPSPESVNINTPFWMSYYDADENYMYVHSIEMLRGEVAGTTRALRWHLTRGAAEREAWRSWRLLDVELLDELQVVVINHDTEPGTTAVEVHAADGRTIWSERVDLAPLQLARVRVPAEEIERWRAEGLADEVRVGLDPLLTPNGKPYVIMRYGGGPLSLHHG